MRRRKRKNTRLIVWVCDKHGCGGSNNREIELGYVLIDDTCDHCDRRIHEPLTEDVKNWPTPGTGKL